jgi:menaquinone-9 beta-reductase
MWDAIIVGAGPAGSALAAHLAGRGRSVLLLDAAGFPREKLCGEYLGAGCVPILRRLGVLDSVLGVARRVRGMRVFPPGAAAFTARYPDSECGLAVRRTDLDSMLLRQARLLRVECLEGFRVEGLLFEGGKVCGVKGRSRKSGDGTFRARLVAGADGCNSVVAGRLGLLRRHPRHRKMALCAHYDGLEFAVECAEVFLGRRRYGIVNPLAGGAATVSLVLDQEEFTRAGVDLGSRFARVLASLPGLQERLDRARPAGRIQAVGPMARVAARTSLDGALLVGDAAGFYDPFTGEGIFMALRGAELAAETMDRALASDDCSARFLSRYDAARASEFGWRRGLEALVRTVVGQPTLANLAARRLGASPRAACALMSVLGGLAPPFGLFSPGFLASLLVAGAGR